MPSLMKSSPLRGEAAKVCVPTPSPDNAASADVEIMLPPPQDFVSCAKEPEPTSIVCSPTPSSDNAASADAESPPPASENCISCAKEPEDVLQDEVQQPAKKQKTGKSKKTVTKNKKIRIVKQEATVKSPEFMASPSSIYAGVCRYDSLVDALHGTDGFDRGCMESHLTIANIQFGGCPVFEKEFDNLLPEARFLSLEYIEEALNKSVRHLCSHKCFLRAYHPIREFTYLWRDITIDEDDECSNGCTPLGSPTRSKSRLKKENLLAGWGCKLLPASADNNTTVAGVVKDEGEVETKKSPTKGSSVQLVYISPEGTEFNTRLKAINYMSRSLSLSQQEASPSNIGSPSFTPLVDLTVRMDTLFSPLGLLEELFTDDPWKLLVSTICLNKTSRQQVDGILYQLLQKWPDAESTANADWKEISSVITPLGLGTRRAKALVRFSTEYLDLIRENHAFSLTEKQVKSLYNVGQYGWTAYEVFILMQLPSGVKVCDHALQMYVEYQLGRLASNSKVAYGFTFDLDDLYAEEASRQQRTDCDQYFLSQLTADSD